MHGLILHTGGKVVSEQEMFAVPTPRPEGTWYPIPHAELFKRVMSSLKDQHLQVGNVAHALHLDGARYFGLVELQLGNFQQYAINLGLRNTHDKSFSDAIAFGTRVFVCDNLAFNGDVVLRRKHTRYILKDLTDLVHRALDRLGPANLEIERFFQAMQQTECPTHQYHDFLIRCLKHGVLASSQIAQALEVWERNAEVEEAIPGTVWAAYNSVTNILSRKVGCLERPRRGVILHRLSLGLLDRQGRSIETPVLQGA